jgi:glutamate carboxypeptidase
VANGLGWSLVDELIEATAARMAARATRELDALVAVSSPSGDLAGAEEAASIAAALAPDDATVERVPCSSPGHADDLVLRVEGTGSRRLVLVGHLDTVIAHDRHRPLSRDGDKLLGSGTVDMKGGVVLALGLLRALAAPERRSSFAEAALLLVQDEEWRVGTFGHVERFAGFDVCLCFEAGQLTADGGDAVIVKRKAAGTLRVLAHGRSSHSGSAPDQGRNALLGLAAAAQAVSAMHDPHGELRLTAVPTILRSGDAFNVVPAAGELFCDMRADDAVAFDAVLAAVPDEVGGVTLERTLLRLWPGMDARGPAAGLLAAAGERLGRSITGMDRGGASDASHFASTIPLTVDGLGPRGGGAHAPNEFVLETSLRSRAEVALAIADAALRD